MKTSALIFLIILISGTICQAEEYAIRDLRSAIQNKQFKEAADLADSLLKNTQENHDYITYIKALALF